MSCENKELITLLENTFRVCQIYWCHNTPKKVTIGNKHWDNVMRVMQNKEQYEKMFGKEWKIMFERFCQQIDFVEYI